MISEINEFNGNNKIRKVLYSLQFYIYNETNIGSFRRNYDGSTSVNDSWLDGPMKKIGQVFTWNENISFIVYLR